MRKGRGGYPGWGKDAVRVQGASERYPDGRTSVKWTPEREALLRNLLEKRLSAGAIAARLGGFEHTKDRGRSAVLGKAHRLGLTLKGGGTRTNGAYPRTAAQKRFNAPPRAAKSQSLRPKLPPPEPIAPGVIRPEDVIPEHDRKQLLDLTESDCRWPIGDIRTKDLHFCGKKKIAGLPYCEAHARRAFDAPKPRRPRDPDSNSSRVHFHLPTLTVKDFA